MKNKIIMFMALLVLAIFAVGGVSAADDIAADSDVSDDNIVIDDVSLGVSDENGKVVKQTRASHNVDNSFTVQDNVVLDESASIEELNEEEVSEELSANFTNDVSEGKDSVTVQFTDTSTGNVTSWLWDFGDGTNSTDQNPTHTYSQYGIFDVSLTVGDVNSVTNEITKTGLIEVYSSNDVIVNPSFETANTAGWTVESGTASTPNTAGGLKEGSRYLRLRTGVISQSINFDTINSITFWAKQYQLNSGNAVNVYIDDEKILNVPITAAWADNHQEINVDTSSISGTHLFKVESVGGTIVLDAFTPELGEGFNVVPFISSHTIDGNNISITFSDKSIGKISSWLWDFGDGTNSTEKNPTHIYSNPGTYNVTLNVFNKDNSANSTKTYLISDLLNSNFTVNATEGKDNLTVKFNATVDGIVENWLWDFGDGSTSTEQNPIHTFIGEGEYTVTLTISNSIKTQNIVKNKLIVVTEDLAARFITSSSSVFIYGPLYFTDKSSHKPTSWLWDFGDGTLSNLQNPEHAYTKTGTYTVTLTVSNGTNSSTISESVTIKPELVPNFSYEWYPEINQIRTYDSSWINPHSTGDNIVLIVIDWGDGTTSSFTGNTANGMHTYNPGTYDITYTIYDKDDASSTITKQGIVTATGGEVNIIGVDSFEDNDTCGWTIVGGYLSNETYYDSSWNEYKEPASDGSWYVKSLDGNEYMEKEINFNEVDYINFWHFDEISGPITASIEINGVWNELLRYTSMSHNDRGYTPIDVSDYYGIHKFRITSASSYGTIDIDEIIYGNYDYNADFEVSSTEITGDKIIANFKSTSTGAISSYEWDFGDGTTSTDKNPTHEFSQGNYTVTLLLKYNGAVMDSVSQVLDLVLPTVGGVSYNSIQAAVDNASENEVIDIAPLIANSYCENLNINKSVTLNFNGASLKADNANAPLFNITNGANVVIKDLIIDTDSTIVTDSASKLTLEQSEIAANATINGNVELNDVTVDDGAVIVEDGNVKIFNSTIISNDVAITQKAGELEIISNLITDNRIAVNVTGGKTKLQYNLIYNNEAFGLVYIGTGVNNTDNWWGKNFPATSFGESLSEDYYDIFRMEDDGVEIDSWLTLNISCDDKAMGFNNEYAYTVDLTKNSNDEVISGYLKTFYLDVSSDVAYFDYVEIVNGTGQAYLYTENTEAESIDVTVLDKDYSIDSIIIGAPSVNVDVAGDLVENGTATVNVEVPYATGSVTFYVNGEATDYDLNENIASHTIDNLAAGNYTVVVVYNGDDVFGSIANTTSFNVEPSVNLTALLEEAQANATELFNNLTDAEAEINDLSSQLDDAKANATALDGSLRDAEAEINDLTSQLAEAQSKVLVGSVVSAADLKVLAGNVGKIQITLKDANNNLLANKNVSVIINGVTYNGTTNDKGVASIGVKFASAGTYNAVVSFMGDETFKSSIGTSKIIASKKATALTAKKARLKVKKAKKIKVTLKSAGKAVAGKIVTIKVNKKTFKAKTNKKGVAKVKVKVARKGKFKAVVKFAGDSVYKAVTKKVKFTVK